MCKKDNSIFWISENQPISSWDFKIDMNIEKVTLKGIIMLKNFKKLIKSGSLKIFIDINSAEKNNKIPENNFLSKKSKNPK